MGEDQSGSLSVTELLRAWGGGDPSALEKLTPVVYDELHRIARYHMSREGDGHTLQATALINEVYLRLVDFHGVQWQDRAHFFAVSAQLMRRSKTSAARKGTASAMLLSRGQDVKIVAALALARIGDPQAETLATELAREYPTNTLLKLYWLPTIHASLELRRGDPAKALARIIHERA